MGWTCIFPKWLMSCIYCIFYAVGQEQQWELQWKPKANELRYCYRF